MQERQGGSKVGRLIAEESGTNQPYRKLVKRLEELARESSALKAYLVPQLEALCNIVSEMVNLGIQVRRLTEHSHVFFKLNSFPACSANDASHRRSTRFQIFFPTRQCPIICQQRCLIDGGKDLQEHSFSVGRFERRNL
jgi:hypothetical protein